jgi:hypothetical protein
VAHRLDLALLVTLPVTAGFDTPLDHAVEENIV